jgi:hypothetical protein
MFNCLLSLFVSDACVNVLSTVVFFSIGFRFLDVFYFWKNCSTKYVLLAFLSVLVLSCCLNIKIQYVTHVWLYIYTLNFLLCDRNKIYSNWVLWSSAADLWMVQMIYFESSFWKDKNNFWGPRLCLCCWEARLFSFHTNIILCMTAVSLVSSKIIVIFLLTQLDVDVDMTNFAW